MQEYTYFFRSRVESAMNVPMQRRGCRAKASHQGRSSQRCTALSFTQLVKASVSRSNPLIVLGRSRHRYIAIAIAIAIARRLDS